MKTTQSLKQEIVARLGFFPPFFEPALSEPVILASLWEQTLTCYLENPLPHLFKEKIAALLARYCPVPYCLFCHTSTLRPLGMKPVDVLKLLSAPTITVEELRDIIKRPFEGAKILHPEPDSKLEEQIISCVMALYLNIDVELCRERLRDILEPSSYSYLTLFLAYNRTALTWAEAHPEISYVDDLRVQTQLDTMLKDEPELKSFLDNYLSVAKTPQVKLLEKFNEEQQRFEALIKLKSQEIDEQRAIALNQSKLALLGEMSASIAHEIKNPLAIIAGSVMLLQKVPADAQIDQGYQLAVINKTVKRINDIVDGLKFYAGDSTRDEKRMHSLKEIITATLALSQHKLQINNCKITVKLPEKDVRFNCIPVSISQALLNLISNACDAVQDQSEKWINLECLDESDSLVIHVSDSGKPIPNEIRYKIMTPFFTTKEAGKGTGLGLTIVKKIIEHHDGKIELLEGSKHTCFRIYFPMSA